jgi:hypothetical protein
MRVPLLCPGLIRKSGPLAENGGRRPCRRGKKMDLARARNMARPTVEKSASKNGFGRHPVEQKSHAEFGAEKRSGRGLGDASERAETGLRQNAGGGRSWPSIAAASGALGRLVQRRPKAVGGPPPRSLQRPIMFLMFGQRGRFPREIGIFPREPTSPLAPAWLWQNRLPLVSWLGLAVVYRCHAC